MNAMTRRSPFHDLVPLVDRMRYLLLMRVVLAACVLGHPLLVPSPDRLLAERASATLLYLASTSVAYLVWRLRRTRGGLLFGTLLLVDSVFLVWAACSSGGATGPFGPLIVVHLIGTALLASYPTAMKIAMWYSLLLLAEHYADRGGILNLSGTSAAGSTEIVSLTVFITFAWLATIVTASFAAVNERELRRRKVDLEDLAGMASTLEAELQPASVAAVLHDSLTEAYGFAQLVVIGVSDGVALPLAGTPLRVTTPVPAEEITGMIARAWDSHERQLAATLDGAQDGFLVDLLGSARNVIVVPLFADGQPVGAVAIELGQRARARVEWRVLTMTERFCAHAAVVLRNAWLLEQLRHVAATDGLTSLFNRRSFDLALHRELAGGARTGHPTALVMVDIDHFKTLNDQFGHQIGDLVLREVAQTLVACAREEDTVARYGGEEFAVILPRCDLAGALDIADRLRQAISGIPTVRPLTASFGVAVVPHQANDAEGVIRAADAALYEAKRAGRNRVGSACGTPAEAAT